MNDRVTVEIWDNQAESAVQMHHIFELSHPFLSPMNRSNIHSFYQAICRNFEQSALVAKIQEQICGYALLCAGNSPTTVKLIGGVHPKYRDQGIGSMLHNKLIFHTTQHPDALQLETSTVGSCTEGISFLSKRGFVEMDRGHWSYRPAAAPFSNKVQNKAAQIGPDIDIVSGSTFESMRVDWDRAWWELVMTANKDIPSVIPHKTIPFEQWKIHLSPPFLNRSHALVALDGFNPVGVLHLDEVNNGIINICYTGVAPTHRRMGLSTALKLEAFKLAQRLGAHTVGTFNHHKNPMLHLNRKLGFVTKETLLTYVKDLSDSCVP